MPDNTSKAVNQLDDIISDIEHTLVKDKPRTVSQIEEEMMLGVRSPSERGGRLPTFYRSEVESIRADTRTIREIAQSWGVSITTITRVQMRGRYRNTPYIPRDEVDRSVSYVRTHEARPKRERPGRPFKSGRAALTAQEIADIVNDDRPVREIAEDYQLTVEYVRKLRLKHGAVSNGSRTITPRLVRSILRDQRSDAETAVAFKINRLTVQDIRDGKYGDGHECDENKDT